MSYTLIGASAVCCLLSTAAVGTDEGAYLVCVSNEKAGTVSLIDGGSRQVIASIPVGKRPRGIHASPNGTHLFVALSGYPNLGPPQLDAQGNPIEKDVNEEDIDESAHGIGIVDLKRRTFLRKLSGGSDPEEFAVGPSGNLLYVSNEDVATMSVLDIAEGKVRAIVPVEEEPEGVALSPNGKQVYVTCETNGEVFVIDTTTNKPIGVVPVGGRPRTVAFSPDGSKAFIPSETEGTISIVDTSSFKILRRIELPEGSRPMGTAMTSDGQRLFVSNGRAGTVCLIDPAAEQVTATIKVGPRPWGIGLSPDENFLYVANGPSNDVSVVDVNELREVGKIAVGESPWGIAVVSTAAAR